MNRIVSQARAMFANISKREKMFYIAGIGDGIIIAAVCLGLAALLD